MMYEALIAALWASVIGYIVLDYRRLRRREKLSEMHGQAKWLQTQPSPMVEFQSQLERQRKIADLAQQVRALPSGQYVTIPNGIDPREIIDAMPPSAESIRAKYVAKERRLHNA